jgi:hypothetical protein
MTRVGKHPPTLFLVTPIPDVGYDACSIWNDILQTFHPLSSLVAFCIKRKRVYMGLGTSEHVFDCKFYYVADFTMQRAIPDVQGTSRS